MRRRLVLFITLVALSGCADPAPRPVNPNARWLDPASYEFHYTAQFRGANQTYGALVLEVNETLRYQVRFESRANWSIDTRWFQYDLVKWSTPRLAAHSFLSFKFEEDCSEIPRDVCEESNRKNYAVSGSGLRPGRYLLVAAAFGADAAEHDIFIHTTKPITLTERSSGETTLCAGESTARCRVGQTGFAHLRTKGTSGGHVTATTDGTLLFSAQETSRTSDPPSYRIGNVTAVGLQFAVPPGETIVEVSARPVRTYVGLLVGPSFVLPDGRLAAFGAESVSSTDWKEHDPYLQTSAPIS